MVKGDWSLFHAQVHQALRSYSLVHRGDRLLLAVSGGQDSMALVKLMGDLQPRWHWELGVVHCDHGWRSESGEQAQALRDWLVGHGYQVYGVRAEQLGRSEQAARTWRYQVLLDVAQAEGYGVVMTGHTASDRAETLLLNLVRGSGSDGLGSLTWERPLDPSATVRLVRPLLGLCRPETAQICQTWNLPIWEDASNTDRRYRRNHLRLDVLPQLRVLNPQADRHLAQTAEILATEAHYLDHLAQQAIDRLKHTLNPDQPWPNPALHRPGLQTLPLALQRRVIRGFLQQYLNRSVSYGAIEKTIALINAPQGSQTDPFPSQGSGTLWARVEGDWISLRHQS